LKPQELKDWPVPLDTLEQGRAFLRSAVKAERIAILCDKDVDGLTSGLIVRRALEKLGAKNISVFPAHKGEHAHSDELRARARAFNPDCLIITDMGARGEVILPGVPTLIVDHHQPKGFPPDALIVSAYQAAPVPSSSVLAFILVETLVDATELEWLAAIGAIADLADDVPYPDIKGIAKKCGSKNVTETIALINAARRSRRDEVETALNVLSLAQSPADVAAGRVAGVDILRACRSEVSAEFKRHLKIAPKFSKTMKVAMFRVNSPDQIHPLLATRWCGTLKKYVVMAANDGYLPGRVVFSMRTATEENVIEMLYKAAPELKDEFGYGHRQAAGGNLSVEGFELLLERLGFKEENGLFDSAAR